jgi:hypothetical protein
VVKLLDWRVFSNPWSDEGCVVFVWGKVLIVSITAFVNWIGLIENMSGFVCPHCSHCTDLFSSEGGHRTANDFGIELLGSIPVDPEFTTLMDGCTLDQESDTLEPAEDNGVGAEIADCSEDNTALSKAPKDIPLLRGYRECSLSGRFSQITQKIIEAISSRG